MARVEIPKVPVLFLAAQQNAAALFLLVDADRCFRSSYFLLLPASFSYSLSSHANPFRVDRETLWSKQNKQNDVRIISVRSAVLAQDPSSGKGRGGGGAKHVKEPLTSHPFLASQRDSYAPLEQIDPGTCPDCSKEKEETV